MVPKTFVSLPSDKEVYTWKLFHPDFHDFRDVWSVFAKRRSFDAEGLYLDVTDGGMTARAAKSVP